mmetsp:Transcript_20947/g.31036  ORF Transcript_20947/g.31036 Transcript_20947/m.31036 type:complete len:246 (+) Transcript_20947:51-788(+)|eukprot:CAMPEP_0194255706 /NCGR_PEP_ID=MMETSP0158-20130606/35080_1 /TAXON_ID=33649 /ORGANISM="Thalassionema nitzschioides, Strain L26-B" /LENGTH=245 /DNA_ID=CAMNT_0038994153 /DNA_START=58 /DNA_END=795 /DNA_ORIENTATION=-
MDQTSDEKVDPLWIELTEPKQFSRLLYTNPVCFLSTFDGKGKKNAMVLSWLTATNNEGRFMFSLNRRRDTASLLSTDRDFTLSVPTADMEDIVLNVGKTSGRWGSKFKKTNKDNSKEEKGLDETERTKEEPVIPLSNRQKKKQARLNPGVDGLDVVSFGDKDDDLFVISGTVAHLQCTAYKIIQDPLIDDDHLLVLAEVTRASVNPSYWCSNKNIFRPMANASPYLTFFGSQTFGYVSSTHFDNI